MKIFTVDLQIAAVLLCPARQDEIVSGLDLEVISLVLVLEGKKKTKLKVNQHLNNTDYIQNANVYFNSSLFLQLYICGCYQVLHWISKRVVIEGTHCVFDGDVRILLIRAEHCEPSQTVAQISGHWIKMQKVSLSKTLSYIPTDTGEVVRRPLTWILLVVFVQTVLCQLVIFLLVVFVLILRCFSSFRSITIRIQFSNTFVLIIFLLSC